MSDPSALTPESRLRLTGGRYEGPGFPIDGLPELVQYERLVADVAKELWLEKHANRRRVPRGFFNVIALRLTEVREGSAIPVLIRPQVPNTLPDVDPRSALDDAQDLIDKAFREIVTKNRLPEDFPESLTSHFLRLGRTLQGLEAIEFGKPGSDSRVRYTQAIRKRFLTATQNKDFPLDGMLVGKITALDTDGLTLTLSDMAGRKIPGSYTDGTMTQDLLAVFNQHESAPIVRLECTQTLGSDGRVKSIEEILNLEVFLTAEDTIGRHKLLDLLRLEEGWLDGEGAVPDLIALERARDMLRLIDAQQLPEPGVFPRLDGSVQLQWITTTDIWTARIPSEGAIAIDYLAVESDSAGESEALTLDEAVEFFVNRSSQVVE